MGAHALRLTYLGWQGWCVESPGARVLIDPVFVDEVGRGPGGCRVDALFKIPRRFRFEALGPVDAVVLSHEHEDHFNIPTLARVDRRIPLVASGLMSDAGRTLLGEMGFRVDRVWSGDTRVVGDLQLRFFGPNHAGTGYFTDEWDTTAYLVRHVDGLGAFASNVDIPLGPDLRAALEAEASRGVEAVFFSGMMVRAWRAPAPDDDLSPSDLHRARLPPSRDAAQDALALAQGRPFTPFPGEVVVLGNGAAPAVEAAAPFLESLPGRKAVRPFSNRDPDLKEPVVGRMDFDASLKGELEEELRRLAEYLYAGPLFRALMSIGNEARGRRRTLAIAFVVDAEGREWVYEYRPLSCDFVQVDTTSDEMGDYLCALLLWATDFWAVARGEIEPRVIARSMVEARADDRVPSLTWLLWSFYHPLRFPGRVLSQYRRALAVEAGAPICVFAHTDHS